MMLKLPSETEPLGKLTDCHAIVAVDTREKLVLPFSRLKTQTATLAVGDYSILGAETLFAVERKSLDDLANCCGQERERFERELLKLRGYKFRRLLVVGSETDILKGNYHSQIRPRAVLASLAAWEIRHDLPIQFELTPESAGKRVERWIYWWCREQILMANRLLRSNEGDAGQ